MRTPVSFAVIAGEQMPIVRDVIGAEQAFKTRDRTEVLIRIPGVDPKPRPGVWWDGFYPMLNIRLVRGLDGGGMQPNGPEQVIARETKMDRPAAARRQATDGAMVAIGESTILLVDVRDDGVDHAVAKTRLGRLIPIAVVRIDDDERLRGAGMDQLIGDGWRAEMHGPKIVGLKLAVQKI